MKFRHFFPALAVLASTSIIQAGPPNTITTSFPYQGALTDGGLPADGIYDFEFTLYDSIQNGIVAGATVSASDVQVTNGVFDVVIDFGSMPFEAGERRFLEISVAEDNGSFDTLSPRIELLAQPYSQYALSAETANTATTALNTSTDISFDAANDNTITLSNGNTASISDVRTEVLYDTDGDVAARVIDAQGNILFNDTLYIGAIPDANPDSRLEVRGDGNRTKLLVIEDTVGDPAFQVNEDKRAGINVTPTSSDRFVIKTSDSDNTGLVVVNSNDQPFFQVDEDGDFEVFSIDNPNSTNLAVFGSDRDGGLPAGSVSFGSFFQMNGDTGQFSFGGPVNGFQTRIFADTGVISTSGNITTTNGNISTTNGDLLGNLIEGTSLSSGGDILSFFSGIRQFQVDGNGTGNTAIGTDLFTDVQLTVKATSDDEAGLLIRDDDGTSVFTVFVDKASDSDNFVRVHQDLDVIGTLFNKNTSTKTVLDHPGDPANKTITHQAITGPGNISTYSGTVLTDEIGNAKVELPDYFADLNTGENSSISYQLTSIGGPAPNLHVSEEIKSNTFTIGGGYPKGKVSWQVTATRQDPWAVNNKTNAVSEKSTTDKGKYHYPEGYGLKSTGTNNALIGGDVPTGKLIE